MKNKAIYLTCLLSTAVLFAGHAKASFLITLQQVGGNVVATGSGTIDKTALTYFNTGSAEPSIGAKFADLGLGPIAFADIYYPSTGPNQFGSGGIVLPSTESGDFVGVLEPTRKSMSPKTTFQEPCCPTRIPGTTQRSPLWV